MQKQSYFLTREHDLIPVEVLTETHFKRQVKVLEGDKKDKLIQVHPKGVAWGTMYPRIFESVQKPEHIFVNKGRALVGSFPLTPKDVGAVPTASEYRFQPFIGDVIDCIHANENVLLTGNNLISEGSRFTLRQAFSIVKLISLRLSEIISLNTILTYDKIIYCIEKVI